MTASLVQFKFRNYDRTECIWGTYRVTFQNGCSHGTCLAIRVWHATTPRRIAHPSLHDCVLLRVLTLTLLLRWSSVIRLSCTTRWPFLPRFTPKPRHPLWEGLIGLIRRWPQMFENQIMSDPKPGFQTYLISTWSSPFARNGHYRTEWTFLNIGLNAEDHIKLWRYTKKNGFVTATKLRTTDKIFVAATKNFAAATKRFDDTTKHFVIVTKCFCYPYFNKWFC